MRKACHTHLLVALAVLAAATSVSTQQPAVQVQQVGQQVSATRTALVDVVVVDARKQPVTGILPADFRVTVDGEARVVAGMRYVVKGRGALAAARALAASASVPVTAEPSRLIVFAVDEDSIDPGAEKQVTALVGRVVDNLAIADRVLLVTLPRVSPNLLASQDRGALRQGLPRIVGRAARGTDAKRPMDLGLAKAAAEPPDDDETTRNTGNVDAHPQQQADAAGSQGAALAAGSRSARALAGLMDGLRDLPGPKTVIVLSGGDRGETESSAELGPSFGFPSVADAAASARAVVHTLHVARPPRRADTDLERLALLTGGCAVRASGGARDLEALDAAMAGSYILQIERRPQDQGHLRKLRVTTAHRGATVLSAARWVPRDDPLPPSLTAEPRPVPTSPAGVSAASWVASVTRPRPAPRPDPELDAVLARVAEYLSGYVREFSNVVAEEVYLQHIGLDAPTSRKVELRRLRSDLLIVQTGDGAGWAPFRDVFEVDGAPVRDREQRLQKLFLTPGAGGLQHAAGISEESARFNLGDIRRTVNLPTLALEFLLPGAIGGSNFERRGEESVQGVRAWKIDFEEWRSPTLIKTGEIGREDFPAGGTIWVEPLTGRIVKTRVRAANSSVSLESTVLYERNDAVGIWTPAEMREVYERSTGRIGGEAKYLNFRRFQVTTEEVVKVPK